MALYNYKVVLLGQGCVGKTSLILRYVSNVFNDTHQSTIQASFLQKNLYLDQDLVKLNIWDTAGQERFHALGPIYYREAQGAVLLYDVTDAQSLKKVRDWILELNKIIGVENIRLAIVGNKLDLLSGPKHKGVTPAENPLVQEAIRMTGELMNAKHYLTSAKQNLGISEMFASLSKRMVEHTKKKQSSDQDRNSQYNRLLMIQGGVSPANSLDNSTQIRPQMPSRSNPEHPGKGCC